MKHRLVLPLLLVVVVLASAASIYAGSPWVSTALAESLPCPRVADPTSDCDTCRDEGSGVGQLRCPKNCYSDWDCQQLYGVNSYCACYRCCEELDEFEYNTCVDIATAAYLACLGWCKVSPIPYAVCASMCSAEYLASLVLCEEKCCLQWGTRCGCVMYSEPMPVNVSQ